MQRRAVTVVVAFLLVCSVGSWALTDAYARPTVSLSNPDYSVQAGQHFTVAGTTYNLTDVGDGSAKATWVNQSARYTTTLDNASNVTYQNATYTVVIPNTTDPSSFTLREVQTVDRPTVVQNNTTYVVVEKNGTRTLVPRDEYLPPPDTHEFSTGDSIDVQNETWTVATITNQTVTLERVAPKENSVTFETGRNATLGGTPYLAYVQGNTLQLTTNYEDYFGDVEAQDYFHERMNGLWGVSIISAVAAAVLIMLAFLPSRY